MKHEIVQDLDEITGTDVANPRNFKGIDDIYVATSVQMLLNNAGEVEKLDKHDLKNFKLKCEKFYMEIAKQLISRFKF